MSAPSDPARASDDIEDYRSPLLQLPGAVATDGEQRKIRPEISNRPTLALPRTTATRCASSGTWSTAPVSSICRTGAVVRISGVDRLNWLNDLTTQRLNALPPNVGSEALILSPQGHVEHHLQLVDDGEAVWVHVEPDSARALVDFLTSMRFMLRVEVDDVTADWAVVWEPVREPHPTLVSRVDPQVDERGRTAGVRAARRSCRVRRVSRPHRPARRRPRP